MTKHKKIILTLALTLILSAVFVCGVCVGAGASGTSQKITATLEPGITVTIDGVPQQFFDANGKRVYPIAYEGSTYLPLRAVCQDVAGFKVGWDQATRTAAIATKDVDGVDLIANYKPYTKYVKDATPYYSAGGVQFIQSTDKLSKDVGGITLNHWFLLYNRYATGEPYPTDNVICSFNLEGKYNTLTFQAYSDKDTTLTICGDNESVLAKYNLKGGEVPQTYTVELMGTRQLSFIRSPGLDFGAQHVRDDNIYCYVFNAYVK